jgi:hypothetical protein
MAIQISGTNVIDNSGNIVNAVAGTFSGTVTAGGFSGPAAGLTGIPATTLGSNASVYTSPGTFVVGTNCPTTVNSVQIGCMGGGGNGGGVPAPVINIPGAGGGGSSVLAVRWYPVSNGTSLTVTVGGAGGTSSVTVTGPGATVISATGGSAGGYPAGGAAAPLTQTGASFAYVGHPLAQTNPNVNWLTISASPTGSVVPITPTNLVRVAHNGSGLDGNSSRPNPAPPTGTSAGAGGRGGSSIFGAGGTGGVAPGPSAAAPRVGGNASGYGSGGGGGGGKIAVPSIASVGGNGSPGIVFIQY